MRLIPFLSIVSYNVVITSVLNPDDVQQQSVENGQKVTFENLQPDTEYQVLSAFDLIKHFFIAKC